MTALFARLASDDREGRRPRWSRCAGARLGARARPAPPWRSAPDGGFTGTIGGGALEWQALGAGAGAAGARSRVDARHDAPSLGPDLGQCCGGRVVLMLERFGRGRSRLARRARADGGGDRRGRADAWRPFRRRAALAAEAALLGAGEDRRFMPDGRLLERFGERPTAVLLFGAGHVGTGARPGTGAVALPRTWIDPRADAFPRHIPAQCRADRRRRTRRGASPPRRDGAFVLVMTHSHALDLAIAMAALSAGRFPFVGLIGCATKRARFCSMMRQAGHADDSDRRARLPDRPAGHRRQGAGGDRGLGCGAGAAGARANAVEAAENRRRDSLATSQA